ncbi:MAG: nucleotidyl transferase AbiEii/AbiGii toxin family protein [Acidobacteria bacterium]|nr:MAG: nucleotidyl transferase AbiEii/AbiGii toxin family protein [Acidobacteriota bacterium]RLE36583.1 MAG: nucleotidyl transferase AbiEii/AbiGii toxin family protein [Acidobacteriota bacterium]
MNPAITSMLAKYERRSLDDEINALREILQEVALCGLWRAKFFEKAAFYGGTALRVLYGLDRFSEDMDFSLLTPDDHFDLSLYCAAVEEELSSWGFRATVEAKKKKVADSAIESAFLKVNTRELLLSIEGGDQMAAEIHGRRRLKIKIEVDTDPPPGFSTEARFLLQPVPFSVRVYDPPSLFAGKMHAVLCRGWKTRVKGRDWYDLVWYVGRATELDLGHLEARMRQSGHFIDDQPLDERRFRSMLRERIGQLDIDAARTDVERFLIDRSTVSVWSREFFLAVAEKIKVRT